MAFVLPDCGEVLALTRFLTAENSKLKLFTNDYTPIESSVLASFTEATAVGYSDITLTGTVSGSTWAISTAIGVTTATYPEQTFTLTAAENVYGYYITNNAEDTLILAERFPTAPYAIPVAGGTIAVTVNISAS